jgi:hypothetical protein
MNRKIYEAPAVRKVRLVVKSAILGNCNTSTDSTPLIGGQTCTAVPTGCLNPPTTP